jgi:hypothetical protein
VPDARNATRQKTCSAQACQRTRKRHNQQAWTAKEKNRDYFRGPENVARVQEWRKAHPGYWRRQAASRRSGTLQDACTPQPIEEQTVVPDLTSSTLQVVFQSQVPLFLGLISKLTGSTLQDDIVDYARGLIDQGAAILGPMPGGVQPNLGTQNHHETKETTAHHPEGPAFAGALELDRSSLGP